MKRYWIFTGQLRDPSNFISELENVFRLLDSGLVEKVLWASWPEEFKNLPPDVSRQAKKCSLTFIEVRKPECLSLDPSGTYQCAQLQAAMLGLETDDFVFKSRPDVSVPFERAKVFFQNTPTTDAGIFVKDNWGLNRRLLVNWFDPAQFFTMCDLSFGGHVSDLRILSANTRGRRFQGFNHNAVRHFGSLAYPAETEQTKKWYAWLHAFYPGSALSSAADGSWFPLKSVYRAAQKLAFNWPDLFWRVGWKENALQCCRGWQVYLRFVCEACQVPLPCSEHQVKLSARSYWADSWPDIDQVELSKGVRPPQGRGGQNCIDNLREKLPPDEALFSSREGEQHFVDFDRDGARLARRQLWLLFEYCDRHDKGVHGKSQGALAAMNKIILIQYLYSLLV